MESLGTRFCKKQSLMRDRIHKTRGKDIRHQMMAVFKLRPWILRWKPPICRLALKACMYLFAVQFVSLSANLSAIMLWESFTWPNCQCLPPQSPSILKYYISPFSIFSVHVWLLSYLTLLYIHTDLPCNLECKQLCLIMQNIIHKSFIRLFRALKGENSWAEFIPLRLSQGLRRTE